MSVNVTVVKLGGDKDKVTLDDGATYGDVAERIDTTNVQARSQGKDIMAKASDLVEDGATITITPKSLKNG